MYPLIRYCVMIFTSELNVEVLLQSSDILRKFEDTHETILPRILASYDIMTNPLGKAALIWIIGEYGEVCGTLCTCICL